MTKVSWSKINQLLQYTQSAVRNFVEDNDDFDEEDIENSLNFYFEESGFDELYRGPFEDLFKALSYAVTAMINDED